MANMFGDANETTTLFACVRGERGLILYIVHRLKEGESKKWAYVGGDTGKNAEGYLPLKRLAGGVVENETHVRHT
jgi:hypothetical protein